MIGASLEEVKALAVEVNRARPDWHTPGILNVLMGLRGQLGIDELRAAAMRAAGNAGARTPKGIEFEASQARGGGVDDGPGLGPLPECRACGHPISRAKTAQPACPECGAAPLRLVSFEHIPPKDWADHLHRAKGQRPAPPRAAP